MLACWNAEQFAKEDQKAFLSSKRPEENNQVSYPELSRPPYRLSHKPAKSTLPATIETGVSRAGKDRS